MSELKHTPGPWVYKVINGKSEFLIGELAGNEACFCNVFPQPSLGVDVGTAEANAFRIISCVNAMEGIPSPQSWVTQANEVISGAVEFCKNREDIKLGQSCTNHLVKLASQRDLLLEQLQKLLHLHACEQEGLSSGQPSPAQWFQATNEAAAVVESATK